MPNQPELLLDIASLLKWRTKRHATNTPIILVPTMGALHAGHLALVAAAAEQPGDVLVSIFVNPAQFGRGEDLAAYPRDLKADLKLLLGFGVSAVFAPKTDEIYPTGFDTQVIPGDLATPLCGNSRPDHFSGVTTIVTMLFGLTNCSTAVFGEKDFQQLAIIKRMAVDLWLNVDVIAVPIVREPDGLALSSRNHYLSPSERRQAPCLHRALELVAKMVANGERCCKKLKNAAIATIERESNAAIEYLEIVDSESLQPITTIPKTGDTVCALAAVFSGEIGRGQKTRLIDNRRLTATVVGASK